MKRFVLILSVVLLAIASSCTENVTSRAVTNQYGGSLSQTHLALIASVDSADYRHAIIVDEYVLILEDQSKGQNEVLRVKNYDIEGTIMLTTIATIVFFGLIALVLIAFME